MDYSNSSSKLCTIITHILPHDPQKSYSMKRKIYTFFLCVAFTGALYSQGQNGSTPADTNAQNNTRWKLNGNTLSGDKFIGTLNQKDLIFKSNNVEGLRIAPNKDFKIPGQIYIDLHRPVDPGAQNLLVVDNMGKVTSINKSGLTDAVLQEVYTTSPCQYMIDALSGSHYTIPAPVWAYKTGFDGPGVIWTGAPCAPAAIGIGTDAPNASLHSTGSGIFQDKVAIGTSSISPAALQVNGLTNTNYLNIGGYFPNVQGYYKAYINTTGAYGLHIDAPNANNWQYVTRISVPDGTAKAISVHNNSHGDAFQVLANGRITSYITDPSYAFVIHNINNHNQKIFEVLSTGLVYAREIKVTLDPFPDYVFDQDYQLMPMNELNTYIQKNGHLPNMPSAEEVEKDGVGVGELEIKLVEKVEELTLYLLEMKEELELLKKENAALKAKVESK